MSSAISSSALGALCVVVLAPTETIETPGSTMNTIQQFRQKYDKAAPRWPPHVTLIPPPQLPVSQVTLKQLQDAFTPITQQCTSIELLFDTVSVFSHRGGSSTIVLEPSETSIELEHLKRQLDASLPERINVRPDRHEFRPHLTVATMAAGDPGPLQRLIQKELLGTDSFPLRVCVDAVAIMSKKVGKTEAYSCASLLPLLKDLRVKEVSLVAATVLVAPSKIEIPIVINATLQSCAHNRASNAWERLSDATNPDIAHISDISLLTYNILNDPSHPSNYDADNRFQSLLRILEQEGPDLIALQEVNSTFLNLALKDTSIQSHYFISAVTMDQVPTNLLLLSKYPFSYQIVQLSTGKKAIIASFGELQVAVVHLTSDYAGDKSRLRCNQFRTLVEFLGGGDAIVMGDFNMESKSSLEAAFVEAGFQDGWTCTQPAGADGVTYHSIRNSLAAQVSRRGVVLRMDRVLVRLRDWDVGKSWIVGRGLEEDVSDHYGVACVLNRACENASADEVGRVQIARTYEEVEKDCVGDAPVSKFLLSQNALPTKTSFATRVAALSALQDIFATAFYPSPFYMTPSAFRLAARVLKVWARVKGMDLVKLGFPPSHALVVLLAGLFKRGDVSGTVTAGGLVAKFFRVWSAHDWDVPVEWDSKARGTSAHREERDRMTVVAPSGSINICRNVVTSSRNVWVHELKRGYDLVCEVEAQGSELGEDFLEKLCQEYPILERHSSFIHIQTSGISFQQLQKLKATVERQFITLLIHIHQRCPSIAVRPWSQWLVQPENDPETTANFILGLSKGGTSSTSPSEQKSALAMLDNLLVNFEAQVMAEEFPVGMWVQALRVGKAGVANLVPAPVYDPTSAPVEMPHPEPAAPQRVFERDVAAAAGISSKISSKSKLRSSEDVFNRIVWDNRFDPDTFVIGYMDRFTGIQGIPFTDFAARKRISKGKIGFRFIECGILSALL
ncbi:hypothetical protein CcCBS67573_g09785 [Chytriomyces confervae]|uniref:Polynucleotide adenylyltransferase n=1 Tax=Chytriomyces confervae TaxID=246404 RepID=A0A507DPS4_9FUNG|nr:hypothetical protein CcCBS67573_g09785 [Chytriomyces confervae]